MQYDIERDLELVMLGAVLARPELATDTNVASRDIQEVLEAIRAKEANVIKRWLSQRGVDYEPGQAFAAVQLQVRRRWLKARCLKLTEEIVAANRVNLSSRAVKAIDELSKRQGELNDIDAEQRRCQAAKAAKAAEAKQTTQKNSLQVPPRPETGTPPERRPDEKPRHRETTHQNKTPPRQTTPQRQQGGNTAVPRR